MGIELWENIVLWSINSIKLFLALLPNAQLSLTKHQSKFFNEIYTVIH